MVIEYEGYTGEWSYSSEHACYYGKIIDHTYQVFRGNSIEEMIEDFHYQVNKLIKRKIKYNIS